MSDGMGRLMRDVRYGDAIVIDTPEGPISVEPVKAGGARVRLSIRAPKILHIRPAEKDADPIVAAAHALHGGDDE